jgi:Mn2+/Fe2+ NRAMP family transporter
VKSGTHFRCAPRSPRGHTHNPLVRYFRILGPGLVTGASDDDPSGITTYSQAGASLGYGMLWTAIASFPLMAAIQLICARIGLVSGVGLAGAVRRHYPRSFLSSPASSSSWRTSSISAPTSPAWRSRPRC